MARAEGTADVYINDAQAQDALKSLTEQAAKLNDQLHEMKKANDLAGHAKAKKELDAVNKEIKQYTKSNQDLSHVLNNLSGASYNQLVKVQQQLRKEMKGMTRDTDEQKKAFQEKAEQIKKVDAELTRMQGSMRQASTAGNTLGNMAKKIGPYLAAAFSFGAAKSMLSNVISVRKEFEKYEAILTNTLGSKSEAQKSLAMIQDFASKTPFSVMELSESFVSLANMGFKPTREEMTKLGDLASSTGRSFGMMAGALIAAQTGEYERLKAFGIVARVEGDKVRATFKGVTTEIDRTGESMRNYLLSLGEMAGVSGSMEAISGTLEGKISNMGDAWEALLNTLGKLSGGIIGEVISGFSGMLSWMNKLIEVPMSETLEKERLDINNLFSSIVSLNEGNEARNRLLNELKLKYPEYLGNIDTEKATNEDILKLQKEINAQFLQRIQLAVYEEELAEIFEKTKAAKEDELKYIRAINREYEEFYGKQGENLTLEEKLIELGKIKTDEYKSLTTFLGTNLNRAQQEQNELLGEYNAILTEQQTLLSTMPQPTTEAGGTTKTVHRNKYGQTFEEWKLEQDLFVQMEQQYWDQIDQALTVLREENVDDESEYLISKFKETMDGKLAFLEAYHKAGYISEAKYNDDLVDLNKKRVEKQIDLERINQETNVNLKQAASNLLLGIMKKDSAHYKVTASALALIDTYASAVAAYRAMVGIPVVGPSLATKAAITAILTGLLNVAQINAVQFASGKYDVIGASDRRTYSAGFTPYAQTGIYGSPTLIGGLGLVGERGGEMVIDNPTLRNIQINYPAIIDAIQAARVPQYAVGNYAPVESHSRTSQQPPQTNTQDAQIFSAAVNLFIQEVRKGILAKVIYNDIKDMDDEINEIKNSVSK